MNNNKPQVRLTLWQSFIYGLVKSIPFSVRVFVRGRMGEATINFSTMIFACIWTWIILTRGIHWSVFRLPTFNFELWGYNIMTLKEFIIYAMPILSVFHWLTRASYDDIYERGESLFWGSIETEKLTGDMIRQWLDPLLILTLASMFYFIDVWLFLFFAIGGIGLFIEEAIVAARERKILKIQAGNVAREKKRQKRRKTRSGDLSVAKRVVRVDHREQEEYIS